MTEQQTGRETDGVDVELLATIDLGGEIDALAGYQLRMRKITIQPGGAFGPLHDHVGRPGVVYVLAGAISEHRGGRTTGYGPGLGWPEDRQTVHWLENLGPEAAVEISVDLVPA